MYDLYEQVFNHSEYSLEKLTVDFFRNDLAKTILLKIIISQSKPGFSKLSHFMITEISIAKRILFHKNHFVKFQPIFLCASCTKKTLFFDILLYFIRQKTSGSAPVSLSGSSVSACTF